MAASATDGVLRLDRNAAFQYSDIGPPRHPASERLTRGSPATGHDRAVTTLPDLSYAGVFWGPIVSPDGSTFLYTWVVNRGEDLMMIENFR